MAGREYADTGTCREVISVGGLADSATSIDGMSDTGMCSDGETAATGNTALRIAANIAG